MIEARQRGRAVLSTGRANDTRGGRAGAQLGHGVALEDLGAIEAAAEQVARPAAGAQ